MSIFIHSVLINKNVPSLGNSLRVSITLKSCNHIYENNICELVK